jgi:hypothetical protein
MARLTPDDRSLAFFLNSDPASLGRIGEVLYPSAQGVEEFVVASFACPMCELVRPWLQVRASLVRQT